MHKELSESERVLILDTIHGGTILSRELDALGIANDVINPYRGEEADPSEFDLVVSPVHLDPKSKTLLKAEELGIRRVSHHQLVCDIARKRGILNGFKTIEVTGTVGKTSTALILGKMLKKDGYRTTIHSSNGFLYDGSDPENCERFTIAPAGTLLALEKIRNEDIKTDFFIAEVSIGFTGIADFGILTSFEDDYLIANKTYWASQAKLDSVSNLDENCTLVSPTDMRREKTNVVGKNIHYQYDKESGLKIEYVNLCTEDGLSFGHISSDVKFFDYFEASIISATILALSLGCSESSIKEVLGSFSGLPGRMDVSSINGRTLIDNSSSGTRISRLDRILKDYGRGPEDVVLLIGEEGNYICESFDVRDVINVIKAWNLKKVVTVGERYEPLGFKMAEGLENGLESALMISKPGDLIISFVKTLR